MRVDPLFSERVEAFGKKVAQLKSEMNTDAPAPENTQDLLLALEELRTAEEELRGQQEELLFAQTQLEAERERYRDLFENAPDAYIVTDSRGMIREANRATARLLGISHRYLQGKPLFHYFETTDLRAIRENIRDLWHTHAAREFLARLSPRGAPAFHVSITIAAITQPQAIGEQCSGIRWLIRDASPRINAELQIVSLREQLAQLQAQQESALPTNVRDALNLVARERAAREQAEHGNQMKDQFLALVVHELRNPLTPVLTSLEELLEQKNATPPATRETLEMMHRNLLSQSRMIGDLLDVARIIHGKLQLRREVIDLRSPIQEAIAGLKDAAAAKRQTLRVDLPAEPVAVFGDAVRLRQIFWNLISNAIKFTPAQGLILVRLAVDAENVMAEVSDNGVGIRPEALPAIFNAFEQTASPYARSLGGLGLGLSIVRSLTEAHGGKVEAQSAGEGAGSTFRIHLPRSRMVPKPKEPEQAPAAGQAKPLRILLVEDHADTRKAISNLLTKMGHHVTATATVEHAVAEAQRQHFDLMISDLSLPDGNGRDILRRAPRKHLGTAVAYSGWGMPEDIERSRNAGFELHLTKPLSIEQLRNVLAKCSPTTDPTD